MEWFTDFLAWLAEFPFYILDVVLTGIVAFFAALPVPAFITQLQGHLNNLPPEVMYWAGIFEIQYGFIVCVSAAVLRFLVRRIPVIG